MFNCTNGVRLFGLLILAFANAAPAQVTVPNFSAATFVPASPIDHPYSPLLNPSTCIYSGVRENGGELERERVELTVLGPGPILMGVQTLARRDRTYKNEHLVEETLDYFAQDTADNVWYFGEDVINCHVDAEGHERGRNSASSWRAGINGAQPGFAMPASRQPGFTYYQEYAPQDDAVDAGTTQPTRTAMSIESGTFDDILAVLETLESEPENREIKYYAAGFGMIAADEGLDENLDTAEFRLEYVGSISISPSGQVTTLGPRQPSTSAR
jgi:hypothetical protein